MHQYVHKPGRYIANLLILLVCLTCSPKTAEANTNNAKPDEPATSDALTPDAELSAAPAPPRILVLLGLKEQANHLVKFAVAKEFGDMQVQQVEISEAASSDYRWPEVDIVVTAGKNGCQLALQTVKDTRIFCTLLTEEGFHSLDTSKRETDSHSVSALVIDQPASRQMLIAHRVYPSLAQFSIFSAHGMEAGIDEVPSGMDVFSFLTTAPLPTQLSDALSAHDALIATSDSRIYNASTLSTVLLTAYGYRKPVIGYSRAYVKAGALITGYSTPGQILSQLAKYLLASPNVSNASGTIYYPEFFSLVDNPRVARSLGLIKEFSFNPGETYTDADFKP